jgi:alpha-L-fucosidase
MEGVEEPGELDTASMSSALGPNLALGRPAAQSSTGWSAPASRAVDGNTDGNFGGGSVTHTSTARTAALIG